MQTCRDKVLTIEEAVRWREGLRAAGRRLVVTNGVFDLMHRGHVTYLEQAAALGDKLLVLVNDDASVTALKGPARPIVGEGDRALMLAALQCVGAVAIFKGPRATEALRAVAPDVYVKGGDYTVADLDRDEFQALQACGAQVRILKLVPGCSTTLIVERIRQAATSAQEAAAPTGQGASAPSLDERLQGIFGRRSIRKFSPREVEQPLVASLLEAAMSAPSARATYPAEFIVLREAEVRRRVAACLPNGGFLASAPLGVLICGDISRACHNALSYLIQDCAACMENLLLAAHALGLGACWLGVHPNEDRIQAIRAYFRLPENIIPVAAAAIGHPGEHKPPRTNYAPEQVHCDRW